MALACARAGARMIHFSTDQVYSGTPSPAPHAENAALSPGSVYGRHVYELMRYWDEDRPEWSAEEREFAHAAALLVDAYGHEDVLRDRPHRPDPGA